MSLLKSCEKLIQIYLTKLFTGILVWGTRKNAYVTERRENVYDIVNAGPNHRFAVLSDEGYWMIAHNCDYTSQEVFIGAALSDDKDLMDTYFAQDVYMYYAQLVGMYPADLPIPLEAQRSEEWFKPYKKIRQIAKTLFLSISYGAGGKSVAAAVRDTTRDMSIADEDGIQWVNDFYSAYSDYAYFVKQVREEYLRGTSLILPDGWRLGPDNPSPLSAGNFPIQGTGSAILRRACKLMDAAGLKVIATLHDAVTLYCPAAEAQAVADEATELMIRASDEVTGVRGIKVGHPEIIRHGELWLHSERAQAAWRRLEDHFA